MVAADPGIREAYEEARNSSARGGDGAEAGMSGSDGDEMEAEGGDGQEAWAAAAGSGDEACGAVENATVWNSQKFESGAGAAPLPPETMSDEVGDCGVAQLRLRVEDRGLRVGG